MREFPEIGHEARVQEDGQEEQARRLRLDYQAVFGTPTGKRVLHDLMGQTAFFEEAFTGNSRAFYLQGKQAIGRYLLKQMGVSTFEGLERMSREALLEAMKQRYDELSQEEDGNA